MSPNDEPQASGNTPLDADEAEDLIPDSLRRKSDLNAWEALNIAHAQEWAFARSRTDPLSVDAMQELHRRMFGETWRWAGEFRKSDKTISPYHWSQVRPMLHDLVQDIRTQYEASSRSSEELDAIAARFHHRLVSIHPWPNGNGRHARLATDILLTHWGRPLFTWGNADLVARGTARTNYLSALRAADAGNYQPLLQFVRS
jgi:Fic-DOC domain mobile mystery protein B